ncbi:VQ motif-containing protein 33 [Linum perenne]
MEGSSSSSTSVATSLLLMNNSSSNYLISHPSSSSANNNGLIQIPRSQIPPHYSHHHLNPSPTTFVQAHTSTFKQVVQMLTGSPDTAKHASQDPPPPPPPTPPTSLRNNNNNNNFPIPPIRNIPNRKLQTHQQQQSFKLYERRNSSFKHCSLMINPAAAGRGFTFNSNLINSSPSSAEILSPSLLDFPKLTLLSPVTPLNQDALRNNNNNNNGSSPCPSSASSAGNCSSSTAAAATAAAEEEEERAIAEKGFYLHPSPLSTPRESEPQLLPLFPLTSPREAAKSP